MTFTTNGVNQLVVLKVTKAGVAPAAAVNRVSAPLKLETSVWPSVMREILTFAVGAWVRRML